MKRGGIWRAAEALLWTAAAVLIGMFAALIAALWTVDHPWS